MFESFMSKFRRKTDKVSSTLTQENLKVHTSRFKENLDVFKYKFISSYSSVVQNDDDRVHGVLSPRAYGDTPHCINTSLQWPLDSRPSIVDKFTQIITLDEESTPLQHRRRNDREEIRRRLAMGTELDELRSLPHTGHDRPARKPSLQSRLQNGMNLQICFMNETASDNESPNSDSESNSGQHSIKPFSAAAYSLNNHPYQTKPLSVSTKHIEAPNLKVGGRVRPSSLALRSPAAASRPSAQSQSLGCIALTEADFFARQARLQTEARMALAQAKEIARMQMEKERRERATSPVTEMVRRGLSKANVSVGQQRRRVSRHMLTDMNIAQLQVIVNELHSQIECLNEGLVTLLMTRDELHMGQDSMLVDIEDLTRFLGAKEQTVGVVPPLSSPFCPTPLRANTTPQRSLLSAPAALLKPRLHRIAALVKK